MASNQNVNKVVYGNTTLIDLTGDNVTGASVLSGKIFHLPSGARAVGTYSGGGSGVGKSGSMITLASNLVVNIQPQQSGSGNPSASNIREISGWDSASLIVAGKNLLNVAIVSGGVDGSGRTTTNGKRARTQGFIPVKPSTTYTASIKQGFIVGAVHYYTGESVNQHITNYPNGTTSFLTFTTPSHAAFIKILYTKDNKNDSISAAEIEQMEGMLEIGATASAYEPYRGNNYDFTFSATVYGGTINAVTGELRKRPYYSSYNGETLVGPWISDRDVYAAGISPTTGAQVVDLGGAETVSQLTQQAITLPLGACNMWATCGDVAFTCS